MNIISLVQKPDIPHKCTYLPLFTQDKTQIKHADYMSISSYSWLDYTKNDTSSLDLLISMSEK